VIGKLEFKHLRLLGALYRFGTISAAAEHLNVSQQAVSQQLAKIRAILDDPVFVRAGRGMVPTAYGQELAIPVEEILAKLQTLPLKGDLDLQTLERTVVISATDYTQQLVVGPLLPALREIAPKVRLVVAPVESATLPHKMARGEVDLALTSSSYAPEGLSTYTLFTERYVAVSAVEALRGDMPVPLERLTDFSFIVTNPGTPGFAGSASDWFRARGLSRDVAVSVPTFAIAIEYLKKADLIAFVPSRLLPLEGLFEIPLESTPPGFEVVAAHHPSKLDDPLLRWMLDWLQEHLAI